MMEKESALKQKAIDALDKQVELLSERVNSGGQPYDLIASIDALLRIIRYVDDFIKC